MFSHGRLKIKFLFEKAFILWLAGHKHLVISPGSEQYVSLLSCHLVRFAVCLRDPLEDDAYCCVFIKSSWITADFISEHFQKEKQLVMMYDILFLFLFFNSLWIFRQLDWTTCPDLESCRNLHAVFKSRFSSLSTRPQEAFPCMSQVTYKINDYIFQVNHSQLLFFSSPCANGRRKLYLTPHELSWIH